MKCVLVADCLALPVQTLVLTLQMAYTFLGSLMSTGEGFVLGMGWRCPSLWLAFNTEVLVWELLVIVGLNPCELFIHT